MSSDYSATAQAIRENQARRNSNSSAGMQAPMFKSTASPTDMTDRRRQSWDWAEARAPSYSTSPTSSSAATAAAAAHSAPAPAPASTSTPTAAPATQQAPPTSLPGPAGRRPSWIERHLAMGDEDTRRAMGL